MKKPCKACIKNVKPVFRYGAGCSERYECEEYKKYESQLERKRKYSIGSKITDFNTLDKCLQNDEFVFINGKIKHMGWVYSMQYRNLSNMLSGGLIKRAIRKELDGQLELPLNSVES